MKVGGRLGEKELGGRRGGGKKGMVGGGDTIKITLCVRNCENVITIAKVSEPNSGTLQSLSPQFLPSLHEKSPQMSYPPSRSPTLFQSPSLLRNMEPFYFLSTAHSILL